MGHDAAMTRTRRAAAGGIVAGLALAAALSACGPSDPPQAREDQARTEASADGTGATAGESPEPSTDAEALRGVMSFPGQPAVLWTEEPLGTPDDGRSVPGPTDYAYDAVLDYGAPAAVAELVIGLTPSPGLLNDVPAWYPAAVADAAEGAGVVVDVYTGVPGFGAQQEVAVVANEPRYVLLRYSTT